MRPSKKILTCCWLIAAALILRVLVGLIAWQTMGSISKAMVNVGGHADPTHALEEIQRYSMPALFWVGAASSVIMVAGIIFVVVGIYQNATRTEGLPRQDVAKSMK